MDYVISDDGHTWSEPKIAHFKKKIRNPQMAVLNGSYFMSGRSGHFGEQAEKGHFLKHLQFTMTNLKQEHSHVSGQRS